MKLQLTSLRLWEIEPYYHATAGKSFSDICALFDTVYVSFYKGLSGVTGAMLLCPDDLFLKEAKMWQRRAGGNAMTLMYEIIDCERGFNENIGTFDRKWKKMQNVVSGIQAATMRFRTQDGKPVVRSLVDPPTCCQGRVLFSGFKAEDLDAARDKAQERTNVRIYNRLWPKQTLDQKLKAEREGGGEETAIDPGEEQAQQQHAIEWMMMSVTENIDTETVIDAYVAFCEALCNQ